MSKQSAAIRDFILEHVSDHPRDITSITAEHFGISRQAILRHIRKLAHDGLIVVRGKTRDRQYTLKPLAEHTFELPVGPELEEDQIWRRHIRPLLEGVAPNVLTICQYGFTEMLNNVIEHSEGKNVQIELVYTPAVIEILIADSGIGIFDKIQTELGLQDQQHAILELSKGKLTTDPERHTGEGIFFTSRMFDRFGIRSSGSSFAHTKAGYDWSLANYQVQGTRIEMEIHPRSDRKLQEVFDFYAAEEEDYGFTRTRVPVALAKYGDENLVSRSQAKRLLARFDRFKEVLLDFDGVEIIGQAFADEIFRVFSKRHPHVHLDWTNANDQVSNMILRAMNQ